MKNFKKLKKFQGIYLNSIYKRRYYEQVRYYYEFLTPKILYLYYRKFIHDDWKFLMVYRIDNPLKVLKLHNDFKEYDFVLVNLDSEL